MKDFQASNELKKYSMQDIADAVEKIASVTVPSHMFYFFSDKYIDDHPELFYRVKDKIYCTIDNTEVKSYPRVYNGDKNHELVYVIPQEYVSPTYFEKGGFYEL